MFDSVAEQKLRQLISEVAGRVRGGEQNVSESILRENSEIDQESEEAIELIFTEFVTLEAIGQSPVAAEFLGRFPRCQHRLQRLFQIHDAFGSIDSEVVSRDTGRPDDTERTQVSGEDGASHEVVGGRLGPFEILDELGRGGSGVVYRAFDSRLSRQVALKVEGHSVAADSQARMRFRREAQAAAGLDHPHIVAVYEAGEIENICYIASAYCPGISLADWLRKRSEPVAIPDAATLTATLAEAVHHAHQRGILHRDLKPGNVILIAHDDPGLAAEPTLAVPAEDLDLATLIPRITDFGLARFLADDDLPERATRSGAVLGTPSYMAPEQANSQLEAIGPATDVYALGAVLYELLTGRPPFLGEAVLETLLLVRGSEPVPPSRLRPKTPRDLETICLKCLEKDPARRYESARELADDLRRYVSGEPIMARPISPIQRLWRWSRRNRQVAALSTSLLVLFLVSFAVVSVLAVTANERRVRAETSALEADRQKKRAQESYRLAREALRSSLDKVAGDPRLKTGPMEDLRRVVLEEQANFYRQYVKLQGNDPEFQLERGRALMQLGKITAAMGTRVEAEAHLRDAVDLLEKLSQQYPDRNEFMFWMCRSQSDLATELMQSARLDEGERLLEGNADQLQTLLEREPENQEYAVDLARAYGNLGWVNVQRLGLAREATEQERQRLAGIADDAYRNSIRVLERVAQVDPEEVRFALAVNYHNRSNVLWEMKDYDEIERSIGIAIENLKQVDPENPRANDVSGMLSSCYNYLAVVYGTRGDVELERQAYLDGLELAKRLHEEHPLVAVHAKALGNLESNLGVWHRENGRHDESLEWFDRAINTLDPVLARLPNDTVTLSFLRNAHKGTAESLTELGRHDEALVHWDRTLEVDSGQYRNWFSLQKARTLGRLGKIDEAVALAEERIEGDPPRAQTLYDAGAALAVAAANCGDDAARREQLCERSMQLLTRAVDNEFDKPEKFEESSDLDVLREREDFQRLAARALGRDVRPVPNE